MSTASSKDLYDNRDIQAKVARLEQRIAQLPNLEALFRIQKLTSQLREDEEDILYKNRSATISKDFSFEGAAYFLDPVDNENPVTLGYFNDNTKNFLKLANGLDEQLVYTRVKFMKPVKFDNDVMFDGKVQKKVDGEYKDLLTTASFEQLDVIPAYTGDITPTPPVVNNKFVLGCQIGNFVRTDEENTFTQEQFIREGFHFYKYGKAILNDEETEVVKYVFDEPETNYKDDTTGTTRLAWSSYVTSFDLDRVTIPQIKSKKSEEEEGSNTIAPDILKSNETTYSADLGFSTYDVFEIQTQNGTETVPAMYTTTLGPTRYGEISNQLVKEKIVKEGDVVKYYAGQGEVVANYGAKADVKALSVAYNIDPSITNAYEIFMVEPGNGTDESKVKVNASFEMGDTTYTTANNNGEMGTVLTSYRVKSQPVFIQKAGRPFKIVYESGENDVTQNEIITVSDTNGVFSVKHGVSELFNENVNIQIPASTGESELLNVGTTTANTFSPVFSVLASGAKATALNVADDVFTAGSGGVEAKTATKIYMPVTNVDENKVLSVGFLQANPPIEDEETTLAEVETFSIVKDGDWATLKNVGATDYYTPDGNIAQQIFYDANSNDNTFWKIASWLPTLIKAGIWIYKIVSLITENDTDQDLLSVKYGKPTSNGITDIDAFKVVYSPAKDTAVGQFDGDFEVVQGSDTPFSISTITDSNDGTFDSLVKSKGVITQQAPDGTHVGSTVQKTDGEGTSWWKWAVGGLVAGASALALGYNWYLNHQWNTDVYAPAEEGPDGVLDLGLAADLIAAPIPWPTPGNDEPFKGVATLFRLGQADSLPTANNDEPIDITPYLVVRENYANPTNPRKELLIENCKGYYLEGFEEDDNPIDYELVRRKDLDSKVPTSGNWLIPSVMHSNNAAQDTDETNDSSTKFATHQYVAEHGGSGLPTSGSYSASCCMGGYHTNQDDETEVDGLDPENKFATHQYVADHAFPTSGEYAATCCLGSDNESQDDDEDVGSLAAEAKFATHQYVADHAFPTSGGYPATCCLGSTHSKQNDEDDVGYLASDDKFATHQYVLQKLGNYIAKTDTAVQLPGNLTLNLASISASTLINGMGIQISREYYGITPKANMDATTIDFEYDSYYGATFSAGPGDYLTYLFIGTSSTSPRKHLVAWSANGNSWTKIAGDN